MKNKKAENKSFLPFFFWLGTIYQSAPCYK